MFGIKAKLRKLERYEAHINEFEKWLSEAEFPAVRLVLSTLRATVDGESLNAGTPFGTEHCTISGLREQLRRMESQIDRLAKFIIDEIPGEPSQSQGAIDTAIRWMRESMFNKTLPWAVEQWHKQVKDRPLNNVHRRTLDNVWRQVIRHEGGDDIALCVEKIDD